jgi:uncharacterized membrane protein YfcA
LPGLQHIEAAQRLWAGQIGVLSRGSLGDITVHLVDIGVIAGAALASAVLGSVAGTGGTAVLLPVLVHYFGIQAAVPMVTLANFFANVSRTWVHWQEVDRRVVLWFTVGSLPLTVPGTWLFTVAAPEVLTRLLGAFLLMVVAWRRLRSHPPKARPSGSCRWGWASAFSTDWYPALGH